MLSSSSTLATAEQTVMIGGGKGAAAATLANSAGRAMSVLGISPPVSAVPQVCVGERQEGGWLCSGRLGKIIPSW